MGYKMEKRLVNKWQTADGDETNNSENWDEVQPEDKLFQEKDIRLAIEWLKEEILDRDFTQFKHKPIRKIDEAFADINSR